MPLYENMPTRFLDNLFADSGDNDVKMREYHDAYLISKTSSFIFY